MIKDKFGQKGIDFVGALIKRGYICGGPIKLDTILKVLREQHQRAEFESATRRSAFMPCLFLERALGGEIISRE